MAEHCLEYPSRYLRRLDEWLHDRGWKDGYIGQIDSYSWVWYKRLASVRPTCYGNEDKPGVQVALMCWSWPRFSGNELGFELDLTAEPDDGVWVRLKCYTLTRRNLRGQLDCQVEKLVRAWKAVQSRHGA